jgi:pyridoxamine 5'-phosphate oxidase
MTSITPGDSRTVRAWLRSLPVFPDEAPAFELADAAAEPADMFLEWLQEAVAAGQQAAHVMTLSTSDADNIPSARNLILKDVDARGWHFATHATSPKGRALEVNPVAALTFFWPARGRQVRVTGPVFRLSPEDAAQDFLARPIASRAATLVGRQSELLERTDDYARAIDQARGILESDPAAVDAAWALYVVSPVRVEFWQQSPERAHTRLLYERDDDTWIRSLLWP